MIGIQFKDDQTTPSKDTTESQRVIGYGLNRMVEKKGEESGEVQKATD